MSQTVGVKFRRHGPIFFLSAGAFVLAPGDHVLAQTGDGLTMGRVHMVVPEETQGSKARTQGSVYRIATEDDFRVQAENERLAKEARSFCRECVENMALDMKLVDVEVLFDRAKMVFSFTAPGRIDFRELVKELVRAYRTRIELRQIGVRHETQMLGGLGNCGQVCCCRQFLRTFDPVTIKMAKDQNLFLNPAKISGVCGRLLCCLAYEKDNYADFQGRLPKMGRKFSSPLGRVKTLRGNLFRNSISVMTEDNREMEVPLEEWQDFLDGKTVIEPKETGRPGPNGSGDLGAGPDFVPLFHSPEETASKEEAGERKVRPTRPEKDRQKGVSQPGRGSAEEQERPAESKPHESAAPKSEEPKSKPKKKRRKRKRSAKAKPGGGKAQAQETN
ncbi:MAG: hypothetical protein EOM25_06570 [Deltaproteobacteria bacterium]|nr:hypothetical protein [Deltaproteobacteria bacterium]